MRDLNYVTVLGSISEETEENVALQRVVVIDNASDDDSLSGIDALELPLTIIRNKENRGFAAACNQGAKGSDADLLLFLNPDTRVYRGTFASGDSVSGKRRESGDGNRWCAACG